LGYLFYKYFNLKAEFRKYEKPYGHEREKVENKDVPYYYKVLGVSLSSINRGACSQRDDVANNPHRAGHGG